MEKGWSLIIQLWKGSMTQFLLQMLLGLGQGDKDNRKRLPKTIPRNTGSTAN